MSNAQGDSAGLDENEREHVPNIVSSGSWRGPLRTHCTKCSGFHRAKSIPLASSLNDGHRRLRFEYEQDIAWFRRMRKCTVCQTEYLTGEVNEALLQELYRLRQNEKKRTARAYAKVSTDVRISRKWLDNTGDEVPRELAGELVEGSAWWLTHSCGRPVRAPRHADRMEKLHCGWSVEFGANWFSAGRALARARDYARSIFKLASEGNIPSQAEIKLRIRSIPSTCVLNISREFYDNYPQNGAGELVFGAQAIDVNDCEQILLRLTGLNDLLEKLSKLELDH